MRSVCFAVEPATVKMSSRNLKSNHKKTLQAIFDDPVKANVVWKDIESLLAACGAEISEGRGSRVRIVLNDVKAIFHRPHPRKETSKGAVVSMRRFLTEAGVTPDDGI
ncbi:MAG: type II toxin-antitoxin system HicA family toxin [Anaerolineae bacterium]